MKMEVTISEKEAVEIIKEHLKTKKGFTAVEPTGSDITAGRQDGPFYSPASVKFRFGVTR